MTTALVKPAQTARLPVPSQAQRDAFKALPRTEAAHREAMQSLACLQRVEAPAAAGGQASLTFPLTVAAWNLERCYFVEQSAALLAAQGAQVVLLSEVDNGMARTGQGHTARDLAAGLGMNHAFGVEFLELGLGSQVELEYCRDDFNARGFHGNALLSRATLQAPVTIRLEEHGHWFRPESKEQRIGTRSAIAAVVATEQGPICAVSVHLESDANAAYRAGQMRGLLDQIDTLVGDIPVILGGDLNTGLADDGDFDKETLFAEAAARGYERHGGPLDRTTTRASQVSRNPRRAYKLDWFPDARTRS
jgi:endonuclease/exonuclease/phosphatase family metal-dependent hydrolase